MLCAAAHPTAAGPWCPIRAHAQRGRAVAGVVRCTQAALRRHEIGQCYRHTTVRGYYGAMSADVLPLCARLVDAGATIVRHVEDLASAVGLAERGLPGRPTVLRGVVLSAIARTVAHGTGQTIEGWTRMFDALSTDLRAMGVVVRHVERTGKVNPADRALLLHIGDRLEDEQPRFARLARFVDGAPVHLARVPAALLTPDRHAEIQQVLDAQARSIRGALTAMAPLMQDLQSLTALAD